MEIPALNLGNVNPTTAAGVQTLRLLAGDIAQIQTGITVAATVLRTGNGETTLNIGGNAFTVRSPIGLNIGDILSLRVTSGGTPTLELVGRSANTPAATPPQLAPVAENTPSRVAVVDVLAKEPNDRFRVVIDGGETVALSSEPLVPGGRYLVQVDRTTNGVVLSPVPETPDLPTILASAILRTDHPPPLGETGPKLLLELTKLPVELANTPAAKQTRETLEAILPKPDSTTKPDQVKAVVERGGERFEANLAKRALGEPVALNADLKGGLIRLIRTMPNIVEVLPSAKPTLEGIETRQASQVMAQEHGGPFVFQIPFLDGTHWRTAQLAIEADRPNPDLPNDPQRSYRVMMHTPLENLGDVWLDARMNANNLQAVLYIGEANAREQVRLSLPELREELISAGYRQSQVDVRPTAELTDRQRKRLNAVTTGLPENVSVLDVRA